MTCRFGLVTTPQSHFLFSSNFSIFKTRPVQPWQLDLSTLLSSERLASPVWIAPPSRFPGIRPICRGCLLAPLQGSEMVRLSLWSHNVSFSRAVAGRDEEKLKNTIERFAQNDKPEIIKADVNDEGNSSRPLIWSNNFSESLKAMTGRTKVLINVVGPVRITLLTGVDIEKMFVRSNVFVPKLMLIMAVS